MPKWRMRQAIGEAMAAEMEADPRVVLLGEDVGAAGGVFKASEGLLERFGSARVRDTPIAEMGFTGVGVGAAALGLRPIVEIMFGEFAGVALDQITTEAAKLRYLSRGQYTVPLVVRMSVGPGLGFGAQHSQTLENWFTNSPGLTVVEPSGPESAYWLLRAAIRNPDPVVVLEPRILYGEREEVDLGAEDEYVIGRARVARQGSGVTVVALGQTVRTALEAAEASGSDIEVIDLGTIAPWDIETVVASVRKTGRLATVEADAYSGSWGSAVVAEIAARSLEDLVAAPRRITCPDSPVPYSAPLEREYVPSVERVAAELRDLAGAHRRDREGVSA